MSVILDKQIAAYLPLLGDEEKQSLVSVIKSFLHLKEAEASISIEQYNNELAEAEAEYEKGYYISHDQMKTNIEQWDKNNGQ